MDRIQDPYAIKRLKDAFAGYTNEALEIISKDQICNFLGIPLKLIKENQWYFSSEEGICRQLDKFIMTNGLIYYYKFENSNMVIHKDAVTMDLIHFDKTTFKPYQRCERKEII